MLIFLLNVFISKSTKSIYLIFQCFSYILPEIFDFHYKSSTEVVNDIINGFAGYIIARNDIKHVRVIYSMAYF